MPQINQSPVHGSRSVIIQHQFEYLYPIQSSVTSPQIGIFQASLRTLGGSILNSASDISKWFDQFMEQALLINMHEYFGGQIILIPIP